MGSGAPRPLAAIPFDDAWVRGLPADPRAENEPRSVPRACYSFVAPTPVKAPRLLAWSDPLGAELGIARPSAADDANVAILAGNALSPGMRPYAARYGGHQFGHWAGQLGDGRAITLGEHLAPDGRRVELQLKGAGRTPYSRFADGRAVLRSSLREYLCSEAMHALGVPTTRALGLVATGEGVVRDMFYDGRPRIEPGAIVCRVAPSFVRFGNFEIHAAQSEPDLLAQLCAQVIERLFPRIAAAHATAEQRIAAWYEEVCRSTAVLVAHWMRVGFVHGVMNTDNMSVLGLTIDYGPYGWLEDYEPGWTPNTTDAEGRRYRYEAQPQIAQWNLARLAGALLELLPDTGVFEAGLAAYRRTFEAEYLRQFSAKLGITAAASADGEPDAALFEELFGCMEAAAVDFTILFRGLADLPVAADASDDARLAPVRAASHGAPPLEGPLAQRWLDWLGRYARRVQRDPLEPRARRVLMLSTNPRVVPRNYLAQLAIDAAEQGDLAPLQRLEQALRAPYDEDASTEDLAQRRPAWARERPGCSMLSCSS